VARVAGPRHHVARLAASACLAAAGVLAGSLLGACGTGNGTTLPPSFTPPTVGLTTSTGTTPTTGAGTTLTTPTSTTTTTPPTTVPPPLGPGSSGPAVLALQQRLASLGYWLGTADGTFGDATEQAVYALQKAAGISRDGLVGPETEAALARGVVPTFRPASGYVIEVDLADDLVMFVTNDKLEMTLNTSTGGGYTYTGTDVAVTPVGDFSIYREVDGMVTDNLGQLWRPKFFVGGIALHGDSYVPPYPVSHGCVRVSNEAINWIWTHNLAPVGTNVWVYT
jgi:lipoprotein-anchoring transpeptidase ErfK/SrfK